MKNILFVESGSGFGGSATCLDSLIKFLDKKTYHPMVAYFSEGPWIQHIREQGIEMHRLHPARRLWEMIRVIRNRKVDLVHANNEIYSHWETILASAAARRPCLMHMRGIRNLTRMEKLLIPMVAHFVIISEIGRGHYIQEGVPASRTSTIYDGVDLSEFSGAADRLALRASFGLKPEHMVIGIVSRLVEGKGHKDLIAALARIGPEFPVMRCLIVGHDSSPGQPYLQELKNLVRKHGLTDQVILTGFRSDIREITSIFDVGVQSSRFLEGFGMSILEAMALGKPVIATAVGGIPELVIPDITGLLVPSEDPDAMAAALRRMLTDPDLRRRLGEEGRKRVEARFDQTPLIHQVEAMYASLLNGRAE